MVIISTAAGFATVWSAIRLEMMRGSASTTRPLFCAYDVFGEPGGAKGLGSASRNKGLAMRRNGSAAAP